MQLIKIKTEQTTISLCNDVSSYVALQTIWLLVAHTVILQGGTATSVWRRDPFEFHDNSLLFQQC